MLKTATKVHANPGLSQSGFEQPDPEVVLIGDEKIMEGNVEHQLNTFLKTVTYFGEYTDIASRTTFAIS